MSRTGAGHLSPVAPLSPQTHWLLGSVPTLVDCTPLWRLVGSGQWEVAAGCQGVDRGRGLPCTSHGLQSPHWLCEPRSHAAAPPPQLPQETPNPLPVPPVPGVAASHSC